MCLNGKSIFKIVHFYFIIQYKLFSKLKINIVLYSKFLADICSINQLKIDFLYQLDFLINKEDDLVKSNQLIMLKRTIEIIPFTLKNSSEFRDMLLKLIEIHNN